MTVWLRIFNIVYFISVVTASITQVTYMREDLSHRNKIIENGNLGQSETKSLLRCANTCTKADSCMSIFYHSGSSKCILHQFLGAHLEIGEAITITNGWKYYEKVNGFGLSSRGVECLQSGFLYDSAVDACYFIRTADWDFDQMRQLCVNMNSQQIKITSQEKQDWINGVLESEWREFVALQGNKDNGNSQYQFDDGTPMMFFNWNSDQSPHSDHYIAMWKSFNHKWFPMQKAIPYFTGFLIVCEK